MSRLAIRISGIARGGQLPGHHYIPCKQPARGCGDMLPHTFILGTLRLVLELFTTVVLTKVAADLY